MLLLERNCHNSERLAKSLNFLAVGHSHTHTGSIHGNYVPIFFLHQYLQLINRKHVFLKTLNYPHGKFIHVMEISLGRSVFQEFKTHQLSNLKLKSTLWLRYIQTTYILNNSSLSAFIPEDCSSFPVRGSFSCDMLITERKTESMISRCKKKMGYVFWR